MFRIGYGSDTHRLAPGKPLVLGGVQIGSDLGAEGHSDADALSHAITDAIFGALALGDIGTHFPDSDERWRGAESFTFLKTAVSEMRERGFEIANVDSVVHLELPKLRPFIDQMRQRLADVMEVGTDRVSVKAKTGEGLGPIGERKAIMAEAIVLLRQGGNSGPEQS